MVQSVQSSYLLDYPPCLLLPQSKYTDRRSYIAYLHHFHPPGPQFRYVANKLNGTFALMPQGWISSFKKIPHPSNLHTTYLFRCHGLRVYPVCVCNTVRLGQDTTWNRRVHGLRVYPVWVCDKVRLGQDTTWNHREHRLSVSPNWVCTMLCVSRRFDTLQIVDWSSKEVCPTI